MLVDVLALALLQLAFGMAVCTLLTPSRALAGGFFALHGALALAAVALAGAASGRSGLLARGGGAPGALLLATVVLLAVQAILARAEKIAASRAALALACLALGALIASRPSVPPLASRGLPGPWLAVDLLLGGLLFGGVVWAMNVGHWYLVSKTLPFQLLVHASEALLALTVARIVYAALGLSAASRAGGLPAESLASLLDLMRDGFFFWSRVLWGLVAPAVLAPFVWKTAKMKSNQAATGLLYVALVFVMIGELLATYLTVRSALPI
jgi:hypothetical protein